MDKTYPVLLHPHQTLRTRAADITEIDDEVIAQLDRMLATLYRADGVGLAANQVGLLRRMAVIDIGAEGKGGKRDYTVKRPVRMINPLITARSSELKSFTEGCLSLPHLWADVERPAAVTVRYTDESGNEHSVDADGLLAVVVQHEVDHLDGIVFPERMSKLRRDMAMKKWAKIRKDVVEFGEHFDVLAEEQGVIAARKEM